MEEVNFQVVQGDTFSIRVTYEDSNNNPVDISDFDAKMDVRNEPGGRVLCASISNNDQITIDGTSGILDIEFLPSQTRKFTTPNAAYQLKIISTGNGQETTILKGYLAVSPAVIR